MQECQRDVVNPCFLLVRSCSLARWGGATVHQPGQTGKAAWGAERR
jgi:hypothetical protein